MKKFILLILGAPVVVLALAAATSVAPIKINTCSVGSFFSQLSSAGVLSCDDPTDNTYTWTAAQTFGTVNGGYRVISGTSDTLSSDDCGKTLITTSSSAVTITTVADIVASKTCVVNVYQEGTGQVTISSGSGATLVSRENFTMTAGQDAVIGLFVSPDSPSRYVLYGEGA